MCVEGQRQAKVAQAAAAAQPRHIACGQGTMAQAQFPGF